jgi:carotenoid cleavage dioxygenase
VISHGGKILALEEGSFPFELTKDLETIGPHDFDGRLDTAMTAHPRVCPETGELLFFGAPSREAVITYYRVTPDGKVAQREEIKVKGSTMMHDWNITRNHVIFMDLPMVFDPDALGQGLIPVRWSDDYGARLGVMPRDGTNDDVTWYEVDPCYVFHPMNAYEEGEKIILDVARFQKLAFSPEDGEGSPPILHRWTIDQATGKVSCEQMADQPGEFPRVHDRVVGLKHRYGYMLGMGQGEDGLGMCLRKHDVETGNTVTHELGDGRQAGEPVFAPCPGAPGEDEGWVITYVYDAATDKSDLVIIDASNFAAPPVARIHMKTRVPAGFHGSWVPTGS